MKGLIPIQEPNRITDEVQKISNVECYTPTLEPFRVIVQQCQGTI
jgi:hypothetical protein